jgi:hypothetical protein
LSFAPAPPAPHLADATLFGAFTQALPDATLDEALTATGSVERRQRQLPARLVLALVVALGLGGRIGLRDVLANLVEGLRTADPTAWARWRPPSRAAITKARQRLGVRPVRQLFTRLAGPVARRDTPGAFLAGRRLMAIDGTTFTMPDTDANAQAFGRPGTKSGTAAYPQLRVLALVEVGTHVLCDAILRPYAAGEAPVARRLARSFQPDMLILEDRGLWSYAMAAAVRARGADFLMRVRSRERFPVEAVLPDASYRSTAYPSEQDRRHGTRGLPVRVIEYTLAGLSPEGPPVRLVTSLLDPAAGSAVELARAYHERWEIEVVIDEVKIHQLDRTPAPHLRSKHPREVVQEVYGVLLAHLAVRLTMAAAAEQAGIDPDRISFTGTPRILQRAHPRCQRGRHRRPPFH